MELGEILVDSTKRGILASKTLDPTTAQNIAEKFAEEWDKFCLTGFTVDDEIQADLYEMYVPYLRKRNKPPKVKGVPFYRTSSTGADLAQLAMAARDDKREDSRDMQAHQARWVQIGTAVGDIVQMNVLMMEKHYERLLGEKPSFRFERLESGEPNFEQFSTKYVTTTYKDETFAFGGSVDGVLIYTDEDGNETRIGLEVKSKQGSPAKTSAFSMRWADQKHQAQTTAYAMLHDLDKYMIVYVNCAHQGWNLTPEQYDKTPDVRVFGFDFTEDDKLKVLEHFAEATRCGRTGEMPLPKSSGWLFNSYKREIALELTEEQVKTIEANIKALPKTKAYDRQRNDGRRMLDDIKKLRKLG